MKKERTNQGITLIALVITIIVLLILAGISIATLTGKNGILTKANEAKKQQEIETAEEKIKLAIGEYEVNQRLVTLYSCLEKIEGLESITPNDENSIPPCHVVVDGYEFEIEGNLQVNYIGENKGIKPEIEIFEKGQIDESKVSLKIKVKTKDENGLKKLILKSGNAIIEEIEISGKDYEATIDVTANGEYTITIIGKNERRLTSTPIKVTEMASTNGTITAGTVVEGKVILTTLATTKADKITKIEIYKNENRVIEKEYNEKQIEDEIEVDHLAFYEENTCYAVITDSDGKSYKTNEVKVKNTDAIADEGDLKILATLVNNGTKNFENEKEIKQIRNIILEQEHTAIGTQSNPFKGTYNGQQNTISNININTNLTEQGMFGVIENATIENVVLKSGTIKGSYKVGGIVGSKNRGTIQNVENEGVTIISTGFDVYTGNVTTQVNGALSSYSYKISSTGGIVGCNEDGNILDCKNTATVNATYGGAGGIAGIDIGTSAREIRNCTNTGNVTTSISEEYTTIVPVGIAGGIVGSSSNYALIKECKNFGDIIANTSNEHNGYEVAGIAGYIIGSNIENCINEGNIIGTTRIGGITGSTWIGDNNAQIKITGCINKGKVTSNKYVKYIGTFDGGYTWEYNLSLTGGIVGLNNTANIEDCHNEGEISADYDMVGGIVGYNEQVHNKPRVITNCTNSGNVTTKTQIAGGIMGAGYRTDITNCTNTAKISSPGLQIAGIVGFIMTSTIENCTNSGLCSGIEQIGGIVGWAGNEQVGELTYIKQCTNTGTVIDNGVAQNNVLVGGPYACEIIN